MPYIVSELEEDDAVLWYVTSGAIDALPIHILAVSQYWPRLPEKKFMKEMKPDLYCITKIVETFETENINSDIDIIVVFVNC